MTESDADVPSPIDLREPEDAREWVSTAEQRRPWRPRLRQAITDFLSTLNLGPARVLELGSGPGLLAEAILRANQVSHYTLFDFSPPMLEMSRERLAGHDCVAFVQGDFKRPGWTSALHGPFDSIVAMQAVHELRHKRHFVGLYRDILGLLRPGGALVVCDHGPNALGAKSPLFATTGEQVEAFRAAGYDDVRIAFELEGMYVCTGLRPLA